MAKKILQVFLVLIFLVLVVCGIVVGSYVFSTPKTDKGSESRLLMTGAWIDEDNDRTLMFDENGNFSYSENKSGNLIADGYYKVNEDRNMIKLFMFPGHYEDSFKDYTNMLFFAQITYSDLNDPAVADPKNKKPDPPTCIFRIKSGSTDSLILHMTMPEKTLDLYSKGQHFTAKHK